LFDNTKPTKGEKPPDDDTAACFDAVPVEAEHLLRHADDKWRRQVHHDRGRFSRPVTGEHYVSPHLQRVQHLCLMAGELVDQLDMKKFKFSLPSELRLDSEKLSRLTWA